ncbi:hypothetical protein ACU686_32835 [Yinghuangia aomiensis]
MIGGGEFRFVPGEDGEGFDPELFVRYAQIAALFPMMQFSAALWRSRTPSTDDRARRGPAARAPSAPRSAVADASAKTGDPVQRPLAWAYLEGGYEDVTDQFLIGDDLPVAPVTPAAPRQRGPHPPGHLARRRRHRAHRPRIGHVPCTAGPPPHFRRITAG